MQYTVNHSEASIIFAEAGKLATLAKAMPKVKKNIKAVVYWGEASASDVQPIKNEVSCNSKNPLGFTE